MNYPGCYIVCDVESGGFFPTQNLLTQIGCIALDSDGKELARFQSYIKPYDPKLTLTKQASDLTGITLAKLEKEGRPIKDVISELVLFLKSFKRSYYLPTVVGHNVGFDMMFIEYAFDFCLSRNEKTNQSSLYTYINKVPIDTIELARRKWKDNELADFKLGTCAAYIGIQNRAAHDAMGDVEVTAELLRYFIECLRGEGNFSKQSREKFSFQF